MEKDQVMYVVCVSVHVKSGFVDEFIKASQQNQEGTRKEPGNVRWDLLQAEEDPTHFLIYEVYHTKEDFPKHQQTPHYQHWKATVAEWMAEPRVGTRMVNVVPMDDNWNK